MYGRRRRPDDARLQGLDEGAWATRAGARRPGPRQYGGGGLSPAEARVLQQEMNRIGAWNPIGGMGMMMFGPTLLEYGTEEQKQKHIPRDRAAARCAGARATPSPAPAPTSPRFAPSAEDKGDHFLVNGQKIWTSRRAVRRLCFCLVRTDTTKKHEGIRFLLIDMTIAGRRGAADQADRRRLAVLRDLLHRREGAEGEPGRAAQRRLDHRQAAAAVRARGLGGGGGGGGLSRGGETRSLDQVAKNYVGARREGPHRRPRPARAASPTT